MDNAAGQARRVVVGMGQTGLSCARYLAARGLPFAAVDSRDEPPLLARFRAEFPRAELRTGAFDAAFLAAASEVVLSPGVDPAQPAIRAARAAGAVVLGDIELFHREARAPVVAITGTNAKSTVTTLVWLMAQQAGLRVACGGNLGTPALELLAPEVALYVLELSSFQLETVIDFRADVAAILNIAPDHLDRYPDMGAYREAKLRVYRGARCAVFNRDDALTLPRAGDGERRLSFGEGSPQAGDYGLIGRGGAEWLACGDEALIAASELGLRGRHNVLNSLAALAIAGAAGIARAAQIAVLRSYRGLPHRCQFVARIGGVEFYDDSKGTNVAAAVAALRGFAPEGGGRIVLIAGGVAKEHDFAPLADALAHTGRAVVLIGSSAALLAGALAGTVPLERAADMDEAVARARALAQPGDTVLLSPACASFDMFRNYEERGDAFARAVRALAGAEAG